MRREYITSAGTMRLLSWHNTRHGFEPHFHDLLFLGVILEGVCRFQSLGRWYEALPGDVVVIPAFTEHAAFCNKQTRYRALYLKEQEFVDMLRKGEHQHGQWRANVSVIKEGDRSKRLAAAMQERNLSEIQEAVVALMRDHADVLSSAPPQRGPVIQLLDAMVDAARLHLPVAAIADRFGYTPFAFSRLFQKHVGMRAVFFRNQIRLLFAEEQLLSGDPVSAVAACWGYADQTGIATLITQAGQRATGVTTACMSCTTYLAVAIGAVVGGSLLKAYGFTVLSWAAAMCVLLSSAILIRHMRVVAQPVPPEYD